MLETIDECLIYWINNFETMLWIGNVTQLQLYKQSRSNSFSFLLRQGLGLWFS